MKKIIIFFALFFGLTGFSFVSQAYAKDLYVAPTGSDSVAYASNDISHPWLTVSKAFLNSQSGDTVYFRAGTYQIPAQIDTRQNLGGSHVTYTRYGTENVTWNITSSNSVGIYLSPSYVTISYINFTGTLNGGDVGFIKQNAGYPGSGDHFTVDHCTATISGGGDNSGFVFGSPEGDYLTITNNVITGPGNNVGTMNSSGIITFRINYANISNNVIKNFFTGIFFNKHSNNCIGTNVLNNNYISGCKIGVLTMTNHTTFSNNILDGNGIAGASSISTGSDGGTGDCGTGSDYNSYIHNTITGQIELGTASNAGDPGATQNVFLNNIYTAQFRPSPYTNGFVLSHVGPDYNLYTNGSVTYSGAAILENAIPYSLASWQAHISGNANYPDDDAHSIAGTPTFVGGASPSTIAGFALAGGSVGKNAASDSSDIGANVSLVGVQGELSTCTESWSCSAWSSWNTCINSSQSHTRTCTDANNCGTTTTKPATTETQSCTSVAMYNLTSFLQLTADWLKIVASSPADVNSDGKVDSRDLGIMLSNWN